MWWLWGLGVLTVWMAVALVLAVIVGRGIRLADRRAFDEDVNVAAALGLPAEGAVRAASRVRRRAIPLPPLGIALAALAVVLESAGYLTRLGGSSGTAGRLLSMDAPLSLPRMYVAFLFAAAALAAVSGASSIPGRRTWWTSVGVVGLGIAVVKAGSTVHARALGALTSAVGGTMAVLLSAALAVAVVGALGFLSRAERRDRRRVLGVLALYGVASVGLSAVSSLVGGAYGGASTWAATATFVEESGEALAAVAFLMAVLAGVAPRLVLPGNWALRRAVDAHTLDLPQHVPGRTTTDGAAGS